MNREKWLQEAADVPLHKLLATLGVYPYAALDPTQGPVKKQTTRQLKAECGRSECGYTVRLTKKWIDKYGPPLCPNVMCHARALVLQEPEEEEGQ